MINKKILLSAVSIVTSLALLGGGAFAAFNSQAVLSANTFSTGTASLLIAPDNSNSPGTFTSNMPGFTATNITPGYNQNFTFWLENDNTGGAVALNTIANLANNGGDSLLNDALLVRFTCTDVTNGNTVTDSGQFSISTWIAGQASVGTLNPGDQSQCVMNVQLPSSADNSVAGKTANFNGLFTGTQTP